MLPISSVEIPRPSSRTFMIAFPSSSLQEIVIVVFSGDYFNALDIKLNITRSNFWGSTASAKSSVLLKSFTISM